MTMSNPPLTEKLVYLALKDIFVGNEIQSNTTKSIRKKVRKRIEKFQDDVKIKDLVQQHTLQRITEVATALLVEQVFDSGPKAKARFPNVFEVYPSQDDQPTDSRPKVAESDATAVQRIGMYSVDELLSIGASLKTRNEVEQQIKANLPAYIPEIMTNRVAVLKVVKGNGIEAEHSVRSQSSPQLYKKARTAIESLDSIRLPLWDQHRILVRVQDALENACFTFAQKHLRGVLQREDWDCTEAVELNRWPKVLLTYQEECGLNNTNDLDKPLPVLLNSITQLRHDTVHRARLSSSKILQHLSDAVLLARLLHDDICADSMSIIRQVTRDTMEQMMLSKRALDGKLADIKKEFAAKRAELEREESKLLEITMRRYKEPMVSVSGNLDRLSGDLIISDEAHAEWGHVHDSALSSNKTSTHGSTVQSRKGQELVDEKSDDSVNDVEQLSKFTLPVPTVNDVLDNLTITCKKKYARENKVENFSEPQPFPAQMNVQLDSQESDPKHSLKYLLPHCQNVSMTTKNGAEEDGEEMSAAEADMSDRHDSDPREYDKEALSEPVTDPASTGEGNYRNDADLDGEKPPVEQVIPTRYTEAKKDSLTIRP